MKTLQANNLTVRYIYLPAVIGTGLAAAFIPFYVSQALSFCYFFLFGIIGLLFFPLKSPLLVGKTKPISLTRKIKAKRILCIFGIQLSALLIFIAMAYVFIDVIPYPISREGLSTSQAWQVTFNALNFRWGLFPWPLFTLMTVAYALYRLNDQTFFPLGSVMAPTIGRLTYLALGKGGELFARQAVISAIGLTIGVLVLALYKLLMSCIGYEITIGPSLINLALFIVLLIIIQTSVWEKVIHKFWRKRTPINKLVVLQAFALLIALVLLTLVLYFLLQDFVAPGLVSLLEYAKAHTWHYPWLVFIWAWWLSLVIPVCALLARFIHGFRLREAIIALMILPCTLALIWFAYQKPILSLFAHASYLGILVCILGMILLLFYCLAFDEFHVRMLSISYLHDKTIPEKREHSKVLRGTMQLIVIMTMVYLFFGMYFLSVYYFAATTFLFISYPLVTIGIYRNVRKYNKT